MQAKQWRGAIAGAALAGGIREHRIGAWQPTAIAMLVAAMAAPPAQAQQAPQALQAAPVAFDIAAQPLAGALRLFSQQSRYQVLFDQQTVASRMAPAVRGSHTPRRALDLLLAGSGVRVIDTEAGAFTLRPSAAPSPAPAGDASALPSVTVTATVEHDVRTEGSGSYAADQASFGKGQSLHETPQSVSVVTRQRMDDQNLNTLTDVLNQTTGVSFVNGGDAASYFTSRGFNIQNIQFDGGAPIGGVSSGFVWESTSHLDMAQYDRVEVLRGADGLFSGSGEPGGVINLVRKRPLAQRQVLFNASAGRWDNYRSELDVTGPLSADGRVRGRAVLSWQDRGYFYDNAASTDRGLFGVLEVDLTPSTLLSVGGSYQRVDNDGVRGSLPRYLNGDDIGLPRSANFVAPWSTSQKTSKQAFASLEQKLDGGWDLKVNALVMQRDYDSYVFSAGGAVDPLTHTGYAGSAYPYEFRTHNVSLDATLKGSFELLGRRHELRVGADHQNNKSALYDGSPLAPRLSWDESQIDVWNPSYPAYVASASARDGSVYDPRNFTQSGLFGALRLQVADPLKLVLGARYSRYKAELYTPATQWSSEGLLKYGENGIFVPYGGLVYELDKRWSGYLSLSESYVSQANYLQGPPPGSTPLDPVTGRNIELGLKGQLWDGRLNTALALYRIERTGQAQRDPAYPDDVQTDLGVACCYIASSKRISQGLDAEISGELSPGWQVFAGYTFNSNKDKGAGTGRFSTRTPKHLLKLHTSYRLPGELGAWKIGGGVTAQTAQYVSGSSNLWNPATQKWDGPSIPFNYTQAAYAVWNLSAEYRVDTHWSVALAVSNLFDKSYYQTMGTSGSGNYYGEPRSWLLTLRGRF